MTYALQTASQTIHTRLRQKLCEGGFIPGERISIRALAQSEGTSIMPARDAVRQLVAEGALQFIDSRSIIVPELDLESHQDILRARTFLEGEVAAKSFDNLTMGDLKDLRTIDKAINAAIQGNDVASYMHNNHAFHFQIYSRGNSQVYHHLIQILWMRYGPSMQFIFTKYGAMTFAKDFHQDITDALGAGDKSAFVDAVRADVAQGMKLIIE